MLKNCGNIFLFCGFINNKTKHKKVTNKSTLLIIMTIVLYIYNLIFITINIVTWKILLKQKNKYLLLDF